MQANPLKARLMSGEPTFCFSARMARTVNIVALAQATGYHGFYVDLQHSSISIDTAAQIFQTALHSDVTAFARVPSLEPGLISRLLDAGAQGILAPDIRSAEQAMALVNAALIAPRGERSVGGGIPNPRLSGVAPASLGQATNDATLLIAMIETEDAAGRASEIIGIDGIDAIQIGSNDLTQYVTAAARDIAAVAPLCDPGHPAVISLIGRVARTGLEIGREVSLCGDMGGDPAHIPALIRAGLRSVSVAPPFVGRAKLAIAASQAT